MPDRLCLALALLLFCAGCGETPKTEPTAAAAPVTSWVDGQPALTASAQYLQIALRADGQAQRRYAARRQELVVLTAARLAARRHERDAARLAYAEARRKAAEQYRVALRKARRDKARQLAALRRSQRERAALLARLRKAREVTPGEECTLPEVRAQFDCSTGHIPLGEQD
jgi:hypothetical protein